MRTVRGLELMIMMVICGYNFEGEQNGIVTLWDKREEGG